MPDVFRSAVVLRDLEGLSYEDIAEVLECSVGTVKSRILRGRRSLRDLLEPLLADRSPIALEKDRSAMAPEKERSSHGSSSRMPHPPFAPANGQYSANSAAHTKFLRQGSESGDLS